MTGTSPGGLGAETARAVATKGPHLLILAGRSMSRYAVTIATTTLGTPTHPPPPPTTHDDIGAILANSRLEETRDAILAESPYASIALVVLNLTSLESVRSAAATITRLSEGRVDVLINNAGVMMCPYSLTVDGFEKQFGANYVGPWLLTNLLLPALEAVPSPRVVFVSSVAHHASDIRWDDIDFAWGYDNVLAYGQSKTASILNAATLSRKYPKITAISLHPGAVHTDLGRHLSSAPPPGTQGQMYDQDRKPKTHDVFFKTKAQGAATTLVAAFDPALAECKGTYLSDCQVAEVRENGPDLAINMTSFSYVTPYALDKGAGDRLWKMTEEMVGQKF